VKVYWIQAVSVNSVYDYTLIYTMIIMFLSEWWEDMPSYRELFTRGFGSQGAANNI
jgi:hypothetical protein